MAVTTPVNLHNPGPITLITQHHTWLLGLFGLLKNPNQIALTTLMTVINPVIIHNPNLTSIHNPNLTSIRNPYLII